MLSGTKYLRTQDAVTDVRLRPVAEDGRCINFRDANVVQHGRFPKERLVCIQLGMFFGNS